MKRILVLSAIVVAFAAALGGGAVAGGASKHKEVGGSLDESFGKEGIASVAIEGSDDSRQFGMGVAGRPGQGSVLATLDTNGNVGSVARFTANGHLNRDFGTEGVANLNFKGGVVNPRDILMYDSGRVVVTGEGYRKGSSQYGGAITRLLPDGRADRSFSGDGFNLPASFGEVTPLEINFDHRDRIVMVGLVDGIPSAGVFVARFLPNGHLDRSFAGTGYRQISVLPSQSWRGVAIDSRNRIVLGTGTTIGNNWAYTVIRLRPDGNFDRTFSGDGIADPGPYESEEQMQDVAVDKRGGVLAVGDSSVGGSIVRFRPNGKVDKSFGETGRAKMSWTAPRHITVDHKGRIIVVGYDSYEGASVERFTPDGQQDRHFAGYTTEMAGFEDAYIDSKDRIVAGGNQNQNRVGVARILNP